MRFLPILSVLILVAIHMGFSISLAVNSESLLSSAPKLPYPHVQPKHSSSFAKHTGHDAAETIDSTLLDNSGNGEAEKQQRDSRALDWILQTSRRSWKQTFVDGSKSNPMSESESIIETGSQETSFPLVSDLEDSDSDAKQFHAKYEHKNHNAIAMRPPGLSLVKRGTEMMRFLSLLVNYILF